MKLFVCKILGVESLALSRQTLQPHSTKIDTYKICGISVENEKMQSSFFSCFTRIVCLLCVTYANNANNNIKNYLAQVSASYVFHRKVRRTDMSIGAVGTLRYYSKIVRNHGNASHASTDYFLKRTNRSVS